jgi:ketosteroid isomerase-like protein
MSTPRELITEFFYCLENLSTSVERCAQLFAEDGVFELPYFPTIGIDPRFEGRDAVRGAFELIRSHFASFTLSNIEIHELKDEFGLFAEYHSDGLIDGTERVYSQDYASRLVVENGKIKLLREYLNIISTARMLLPNGLQDVPERPKNS